MYKSFSLSIQTPSELVDLIFNVYSPGLKFVYVALGLLPT